MEDLVPDVQLQSATSHVFQDNCSYNTVSHNVIDLNNETLNFGVENVKSIAYSSLYQVVTVTVGILIFTIGMLGNILVILVVCRTKSMHSPTNCYLISLSLADILVLISATLPSIPEPFFQKGQWPWGGALCSILVFLQYLGVDASSLSITAFTVERYIAICHPMRAQRMCTVQRAKRIIAIIWIFAILYCAPWLGLTRVRIHPKLGIEICDYRLSRNKYLAYYMTDLIAFYVIPLVISGVLYALITRILFMNSIPQNHGGTCIENSRCRVKKSTKNSRKQVRWTYIS